MEGHVVCHDGGREVMLLSWSISDVYKCSERRLIRFVFTSYSVWRCGSVKIHVGNLPTFYTILVASLTHFIPSIYLYKKISSERFLGSEIRRSECYAELVTLCRNSVPTVLFQTITLPNRDLFYHPVPAQLTWPVPRCPNGRHPRKGVQ